ncbi:hypothetical protein H7U37_07980 [Pseudoflavonifractor phocaeensis]|uniref:hypothetical protein n=1 Tax=Pseudoflavonifractor phocaeensis TaxID=1870988 RepID=UPI001957747D|nr:hypothetical protein [Pseudoflavonifractor phocaeensis]MBM6938459.1 hypothetical protein [Pseudoflavonifractor phocaeensis]
MDRLGALRSAIQAGTAAEDQRAEWAAGLKGSYNVSDLNRVQDAAEYLRDILVSAGYAVELAPLPTWTRSDIPTASQLADYLDNVRRLRDVLAVEVTLPETMARLTWQGANAIEEALRQVEVLLGNMEKAWFYSGDLYAGEV